MVEFWLGTFPIPGRIAEIATLAERDGWDGLAFTDSQNLGGDTFAALGIAAQCTDQITLATGATNPVTRHPAVIASAIATLHVESGGRAWLGIARGHSGSRSHPRKAAAAGTVGAGAETNSALFAGGECRLRRFPQPHPVAG